jgi:small subunit ribosomal protein S16
VSTRIRLKRFGTKKRPFYRIVVTDSRNPRGGHAIEEVGLYHPIEVEDKQLELKEDRIREWLDHGAKPSDTVKQLLNKRDVYLD